MSFTPTLPVSQLLKSAAALKDDTSSARKSREEWKKLKELEEARKLGNVPAQTDETGKDINPHIPQYIAQAPWYFGSMTATLKHQREQAEKLKEFNKIEIWYEKGLNLERPTKYRKGACENCGSMTHKRRIVLKGQKILKSQRLETALAIDSTLTTNAELITNDDITKSATTIDIGNNNNEKTYDQNLQTADPDEDEAEDEDKYADSFDMPGTKHDSKQRITVRNLRIREDTAKYLYNLDPDSAFYDPKTRSMRANPFEESKLDPSQVKFAGDNFVRYSGDTQNIAKQQLFAWEAIDKGIDVNQQSEPTKLELLYREFKEKREELKGELKNTLFDKYGKQDDFEPPSNELLLAQIIYKKHLNLPNIAFLIQGFESYVEYARSGQVIKGHETPTIQSRYEENYFPQNHTSIWGSFWYNHCWGYECCCAFIKQSYCTGERGRKMFKEKLLAEKLAAHDTDDFDGDEYTDEGDLESNKSSPYKRFKT